jgi:hypothetical protein
MFVRKAFSPALLDPAAWWDAADASTITVSSGDVSQWDDRTGNGWNVAQGTVANQPRYGDVTLNGVNVLTFTAANGERLNGTQTGFNALTNGSTLIAVARSGSNAASKILVSQALGSGTAATVFLQALDTEVWNSNVASASVSVGSATTTWRRHAVVIPAGTGNNVTIEQDGGATTATSSGTTSGTAATGVLRIGTNAADTGARFLGDVAEIILWDRELTATERARVDAYLVRKWGL